MRHTRKHRTHKKKYLKKIKKNTSHKRSLKHKIKKGGKQRLFIFTVSVEDLNEGKIKRKELATFDNENKARQYFNNYLLYLQNNPQIQKKLVNDLSDIGVPHKFELIDTQTGHSIEVEDIIE